MNCVAYLPIGALIGMAITIIVIAILAHWPGGDE